MNLRPEEYDLLQRLAAIDTPQACGAICHDEVVPELAKRLVGLGLLMAWYWIDWSGGWSWVITREGVALVAEVDSRTKEAA